MAFAQELEKQRNKLGLNMKEMALKLGVKHTTYYNWEKEGKMPTLEKIETIASKLGIGPASLLGIDEDKKGEINAILNNFILGFANFLETFDYSIVEEKNNKFKIIDKKTNNFFIVTRQDFFNKLIEAMQNAENAFKSVKLKIQQQEDSLAAMHLMVWAKEEMSKQNNQEI